MKDSQTQYAWQSDLYWFTYSYSLVTIIHVNENDLFDHSCLYAKVEKELDFLFTFLYTMWFLDKVPCRIYLQLS